MNKKIVAVGVVIVIVLAAACAVVVYSNSGQDDEYEYDSSLGWYSWDPIAFETKSAYFSITPLIVTGAELMFEEIYWEEVDFSGYTIDDVPDDFLAYDSLVVSVDSDTVTVLSTVRAVSGESTGIEIETVVDKCPDNLLCTAGYAATLYTLLEMKYGSDVAETMLWEYVFALDSSSFSGGSADMAELYGLTIPDGIISVSSTYYLINNLESYVDYISTATEDGGSFLMMASGALGNGYAELSPFYDVLESAEGPAAAVFFFSNGIEDVLAAFEVVGAIYDLEEEAQEFIDDMRLTMYIINQTAISYDLDYTVYLESNSGTACGNGTITSDVFELLNLTNINTTDQWQTISDEIIEMMPDVIIFYDTNTKSWDERMRVGVSVI